MKELLKINYNLNENFEIIENKDYCYFTFNEKKYYFVPYNRSEEELNDIILMNEELLLKKIPTAKFIPNKNNQFINFNANLKYVLLEFPLNISKEYNILDIVYYADKLVLNSKQSILYRNNWAELWSSKIDYFEYQVAQLGKNKPIVLNTFSYYVGLAENAIAYVNNTLKNHQNKMIEKVTLQRKRINFPNVLLNYFNPLNYIIDIELRDVASYFKSLFFNSYEELWIEVKAYLNKKRLSIFGYQLLYARLLYPSYYFDIYEKVMENQLNEDELLKIINKSSDYEKFLKEIFIEISKYAPIEKIDWLINKKEF